MNSLETKKWFVTFNTVQRGRLQNTNNNNTFAVAMASYIFAKFARLICLLDYFRFNCFAGGIINYNIVQSFKYYSVPIFKNLPQETLIKISDVLDETSYQQGDYIVSAIASSTINNSHVGPTGTNYP